MISSTLFCDHCGGGNQAQATYCRFCGRVLHAGRSALYHTETGRLLIGILLKQRYRIMAALGEGGMGAVYQAEDTQLGNRQVALKEMGQSGLSPQERHAAAEAFRQEAVMLARLNHPGLPSIFDHFEENGRWYLVMSFIEGETLDTYLSRAHGSRLPVSEVVQIGLSLCTVLSFLHNQYPPIIFRDLKPANIMRTPDGNLYLIDFGIARHFKPGQTKDTAYYGSMGYAPPEQYGKAQTTPRSDIYSLGVILHQLLSGHDPASTPFRFPALVALVPHVPIELATLIGQMLDLDDEKRPANVLQIKQELQALLYSAYSTMPALPTVQNPPPFKPPFSQPASSNSPTVKPLSAKPPTVPPVSPALTREQWLETGDNHAKTRHYLDALVAYDRALRLDASFADAHGHKALVLYELRRFEDALSASDKALRFNPADLTVMACKANALAALGRYEEAISVHEQAIHLAPTNALGYYGKAESLEALGRREEALKALEQTIELAPTETRGYYRKADILEALDQREAALAVLEQAINLAPDDLHGYRTKALLLEALERNEEALSAREQIIRLDPTDAYNYYYKSSLLEKLERGEEAIATYEQAIQLDPSDDFMYQRKAALLYKLKRLPEALDAYEQAIHLRPEAASAYRGKGDILTQLARPTEARAAYEQAARYESA